MTAALRFLTIVLILFKKVHKFLNGIIMTIVVMFAVDNADWNIF